MKLRRFLAAWGPVILWVAIMLVSSTQLMSAEQTSRFLTPFLRWLKPDMSWNTIAHIHLLVRKAAHLIEYAILAGLVFRALRGVAGGFWRRAAMAFVPALIFAAADEYHQSFVPSRTSSARDVFIDCAGALFGILICRAVHLALTWRDEARE
ncbi:MAG TPA: VanZ family protein [Chthoniobacterales bacterium]|nr:VanZ family protein [Chthoniobacterales bacterium]